MEQNFKMIPGTYDTYGNDIVSGSGLSLEQMKQKCLDTPGSGGFVKRGDSYFIKNKNMWPRGNRQKGPTNMELYVRIPSVVNDISCSNEVKPTTSTNIRGRSTEGMMTSSTKCSLGIISR